MQRENAPPSIPPSSRRSFFGLIPHNKPPERHRKQTMKTFRINKTSMYIFMNLLYMIFMENIAISCIKYLSFCVVSYYLNNYKKMVNNILSPQIILI